MSPAKDQPKGKTPPSSPNRRMLFISIAVLAALVLIATCSFFVIWAFPDDDSAVETVVAPASAVDDPAGSKLAVSAEKVDPAQATLADAVDTSPEDQNLYTEEIGYHFSLTANVEGQGQYSWQGKIVVAPQRNGDVVASTGVAIPNRWIIVPLQTLDDAEKIWVRHAGRRYEATVRKRLDKLGFATLQIDRREKFPAPLCDLENQLSKDSQDLRLVYLNSAGKVTVSEEHDVVSVLSKYKHVIRGNEIADQAIGGIVLQGQGRIAGLIAHRSHNGDVHLIPWERIGSGWGKDYGRGIFDYETPVDVGNEAATSQFHSSHLVQVLVAQKGKTKRPQESKLRSFIFDTKVESRKSTQSRLFADWQMVKGFSNSSERNIEFFESIKDGMLARPYVNPTQRKPGNDELVQLPFLMGAPIQWTHFRVADPSVDSWQTGKKVWANLRTGSSVRPNDMFQQSGEWGFERKDDVRVTGRSNNWLALERSSNMVPDRGYINNQIKISGSETLEVDFTSGFVRKRNFKGSFSQRSKDGELHTATLYLSVERLNASSTKSTPVYWRN